MELEEIYEGNGEVDGAQETNIMLRSLCENSKAANHCETASSMQLMLQDEVNDEAVVNFIFSSCDESKSGYVHASVLVEYLSQACGNNNLQQIFQQLLAVLDPDGLDVKISIETFQEALKRWITVLTSEESKDTNKEGLLSPSQKKTAQLHKKSPSKNRSISEYLSGSFNSSMNDLDLQELNHKFNKIQEENKLLKTQMGDVEELLTMLKTENIELKSIITKVEQEASDVTAKSQHLQEDNGALQDRLEELKEELQKIAEAYNECQLELKAKIQELNVLEVNTSKEEHHSENLSETVRHLEEALMIKEKELRAKDEEIKRIAEELIEQQISINQPIKSEDDNQVLREDTLASELQSSLGTPWKRLMLKSVLKPDSIPSIAWSAMLSEPEFEDTPKKPVEQEELPMIRSPKRADGYIIGESATKMSFGQLNSMGRETARELSVAYDDSLTHSTPFNVKKLNFETANSDKKLPADKRALARFAPLESFLKLIFVLCCIGFAFFCALMIAFLAIAFFLLSFVPYSSGCDGVSCYQQQGPDLYPTSMWLKVISLLKPYCHFEYIGHPPV